MKEVYHITTKSIAEYIIFNNEKEYLRMKQLLQYYQAEKPAVRFSYFMEWQKEKDNIKSERNKGSLVRIIAYCLMPTHIHLILQPLKEKAISIYMSKILNSYSRYFNESHNRQGPLWTGRFKKIEVKTDEQLMHLTRYIHLNPVTAYLVDKPELWCFSSYGEYIEKEVSKDTLCEFKHLLDMKAAAYKDFVMEQISYQRELAHIKNLID